MGLEDKVYQYICKASNKILSKFIKVDEKYNKITDIDLEEVKQLKSKYGIGGIILDVDGTIRIESKEVSPKNIEWIKFMRRELKMCILSNGCDFNIKSIADALDIPYINFAIKPRRKPFLKAANLMGIDPQNILVIGNEYITDIFGGYRSGMNTAIVDDLDFEK